MLKINWITFHNYDIIFVLVFWCLKFSFFLVLDVCSIFVAMCTYLYIFTCLLKLCFKKLHYTGTYVSSILYSIYVPDYTCTIKHLNKCILQDQFTYIFIKGFTNIVIMFLRWNLWRAKPIITIIFSLLICINRFIANMHS